MEEGNARLTVKAEFFYAYDGIVASTEPGWLQLAFDTLTGIFDWVGLQKNVRKTGGGGVQAMPVSRGAGRRGLHTAYDRVGTQFQGETAGTGALTGVREGTGKGVDGGAPPNPARRVKRGVGAGGR